MSESPIGRPAPTRELRDITAAFARLCRDRQHGVLLTVVRTEGSTYRRPGARALVLPDETVLGLVSGGCLEGDLVAHAREVRAGGRARRVRYDSRAEDDVLFGLGLGCRGVVDVLLERVGTDSSGGLDHLAAGLDSREPTVLATVTRAEDDSGELAVHWDVGDDAPGTGPFSGPDLAGAVRAAAHEARAAGDCRLLGRGATEVLVESVGPATRLLVLGAGPDAPPLVALADAIGWEAVAVDARAAYARADRLPGARRVIECVPEDLAGHVSIDAHTVAVVMTHNYPRDLEWLRVLLGSRAPYIGVLGPRARTDEILEDLGAEGLRMTPSQLERIHAPAGLDIGADAPQEIALSVVAEIQAVLAGHPGGRLRDRKGPIHDAPE